MELGPPFVRLVFPVVGVVVVPVFVAKTVFGVVVVTACVAGVPAPKMTPMMHAKAMVPSTKIATIVVPLQSDIPRHFAMRLDSGGTTVSRARRECQDCPDLSGVVGGRLIKLVATRGNFTSKVRAQHDGSRVADAEAELRANGTP